MQGTKLSRTHISGGGRRDPRRFDAPRRTAGAAPDSLRGYGNAAKAKGSARVRVYAPPPMTTPGEDAAKWLAGRAKEMEEALATLVGVNSFTENVEGGRAV